MAKKSKKFDCVAMKRAAQRRIRARVRGLTPQQEVDFFRAGGAEFETVLTAARRREGSDVAEGAASSGVRKTKRRTGT